MRAELIDAIRQRLAAHGTDPQVLRRFAPSHSLARRFEQTPADARRAGVLMLLFQDGHAWHFPLILRARHLRHHQGQIGLPGGACEPGESPAETAERELYEELGPVAGLELLGPLTPFFVPASGFVLYPWVGWTADAPRFQPNASEVEQVLSAPLAPIIALSSFSTEEREIAGQRVQVPCFSVGSHSVWGATCIVLGEFATRCAGLSV